MQPIHTPVDIFNSTLAFLERLTAISSPSGDLEGLGSTARCLAEELRRLGLQVEIRPEAGADDVEQPVLYAWSGRDHRSSRSGRHLLLIGHLDTVLPAAEPQRRDGRLFATGAIDMKGGLAALTGALELLARRSSAPPDDLLLIVVPDEEVAGYLSQKVVARHGARARGLWVLEPGSPRSNVDAAAVETSAVESNAIKTSATETLVTGRRGMFDWHLQVRGQSAHAGNAYWTGRSAIDAAAEWCLEARRLAKRGRGPTVNIGRIVGGELGFVEALAAGADLVGTSRQVNVVPDRAIVDGEARFLGRTEGDELRATMCELTDRLAAEHHLEMEFTPGPIVPPVDPSGPSRQQSQAAVEFARRAGWTIDIEEDRGGISFSNFLPDPSAIPILDGLGPVGDGMHTREEYVELASLDRRIALLADLLAKEAGAV